MPSSSSCAAGTGAGAPVSGSTPLDTFGEGDDLPDVGLAREQRDEPVEAEREAAVRRRAHLERLQQEAELLLRLLLAQAERAEDALLDVLPVDRIDPEPSSHPFQHEVEGLAQSRLRIALDQFLVPRCRLREGVVAERPAPGLLVELEEREVDDRRGTRRGSRR